MMSSLLSAACAALVIASPSSAFVPSTSNYASVKSSLSMSKYVESTTTTRRGFMDNVATTTAAIAGASSVWMQPSPAMAYGLNKANDKLAR
jgi:hypothetical protein